ncbi:MAG: DUF2207 domain-containing protein, partial [Chlorobiaceae bacterium]|nr:DUF2207 domain-containing protein [Chlorobiaceae bacterium]
MSEIKQLALLVIATLVLGIIGLGLITVIPPLFEGNLVVDSYDAVLYENGTLTEQYTYDVRISGEYRMLFRFWEAPLTFRTSSKPSVQFVSATVPSGTFGYAKDEGGNVNVIGVAEDSSLKATIRNLAETNEVGIYKPDYFDEGKYTVAYTYVLHPPIEYDSSTSHLNLKFAGGSHIPYRNVRITVPATNVEQVFVYPPMMKTEKNRDSYVITGSVAGDENLAVEILSNADGFNQIQGYRNKIGNVRESTNSAVFWYNLTYYMAYFLNYCAKIAVLFVPFLLLSLYYRYGREKSITVPEYLSTIPNPALKPWQVNLLFKGDAQDFNEDGYYATLLDLHRKKIISITEKGEGKGIEIRVLSGATTDPYEQRVLGFIDLVAENGVFDTAGIEALALRAKTNSSAEEKALKYQRTLTDVTGRVDTTLVSQYIVDGRDHLVPLLLTGIVLFAITLIFAF